MKKIISNAFAITFAIVLLKASSSVQSVIFIWLMVVFLVAIAYFVIYKAISKKLQNTFIKIVTTSILCVGLYGIIISLYIGYIHTMPPTSKTLLENKAIRKVLDDIDLDKYNKDLFLYDYSELAQQYRDDLKTVYKEDLSFLQKKQIWDNYVRLIISIDKSKWILNRDIDKIDYQGITYRYLLSIYKNNSYSLGQSSFLITKLDNLGKKSVDYKKIDFTKLPKTTYQIKKDKEYLLVTIPYIAKSILIKQTDKKYIDDVVRYFDIIHKSLIENSKFLKEELPNEQIH